MNIEELMNASPSLNASDINLLQYIIQNRTQIKQYNTQELAAYCHVSRTTLLRVTQKLGLSAISDLQMLLHTFDEQAPPAKVAFESVCELYHHMVDSIAKIPLKEICQLLYAAETIYVYGTGNEQKTIADEFKRIFTHIAKCVIEVFDYGEAEMVLDTLGKQDLYIIISLSGETKEGIRIIDLIRTKGIRTLSITRLQNNTIARMCDYNLHVTTNTIATQISYELVAGFYMLLDTIFINYLDYVQEVAHGT